MNKIYVGDYGTQIELETDFFISEGSQVQIMALRPDGLTDAWTAEFLDTKVIYVTQSGDIALDGMWYLQAYVHNSSGTRSGETVPLYISPAFQ